MLDRRALPRARGIERGRNGHLSRLWHQRAWDPHPPRFHRLDFFADSRSLTSGLILSVCLQRLGTTICRSITPHNDAEQSDRTGGKPWHVHPGVPIGMFVDNRGTRPAVLAGSVLLGVGYFPFKASYESGSGSVPLMCFFSYLTGLGGCMAFAASVKTSALNWPHHRGTATAFPLAAFGLSAFFFSFFGGILFPGDTSDFLMLLAVGTFGLTYYRILLSQGLPAHYIPRRAGRPRLVARAAAQAHSVPGGQSSSIRPEAPRRRTWYVIAFLYHLHDSPPPHRKRVSRTDVPNPRVRATSTSKRHPRLLPRQLQRMKLTRRRPKRRP